MRESRLLLVDSNALIHRAYHAFPKSLATKDGVLTNAAFGFTKLLLQVIKKFEPEYVICAFDAKGKTFRSEIFADYKATRKKTDPELVAQFPLARQVVNALNIPLIELSGYEADDVIGTLSKSPNFKDVEKIIVTGDRDLLQLVDKHTKVFLAGSSFSQAETLDEEGVVKKLGVKAIQVIEFKGLRGDSSDNIPGVKGIGDKGATELLSKYLDIDEIYKHLEEITGAIGKKLHAGREMAYMSRELATIKTDLDLKVTKSTATLANYDRAKVEELFRNLQFTSILRELPRVELQENSPQMVFGDVAEDEPAQYDKWSDVKMQLGSEEIFVAAKILGNVKSAEILEIEFVAKGNAHRVKLTKTELNEFADLIAGKRLVIANAKHFLHAFYNVTGKWLMLGFDCGLAHYILSGGNNKTEISDMRYSYECKGDSSADQLKQIYTQQVKAFESDKKLAKLFYDVEMPLVSILAKMEQYGIVLDINHIKEVSAKLDGQIATLIKNICDEVGYEFNVASPKQLGEAIFGKLQLQGGKKTKTGAYATNEKVLASLKSLHPIIAMILEYRELSKLRSTYTDTLIALVNPQTKKIHTTLNQTIAATGRLSSINPNLQNIPISTESGMEIRRAFVADAGKKFLFFDYSQQELRLLADFSNDENLISAFNNDLDIHAFTASKLFEKPIDEVDKNERRAAKTINFGIVYGISNFGLAERLDIPRSVAQKFIDTFYNAYPAVKQYFATIVDDAKKSGKVETLLGRFRRADGLQVNDFRLRAATEREVINFPLQGSAADLVKVAMVAVADKLKGQDDIEMVLQIHDELVFEVSLSLWEDKPALKKKIDMIVKAMQPALNLKVNMKIGMEFGDNLADKKPLNF